MSSHQSIRNRPIEAIKEGRVIYVGNLHFKSKKEDVANFFGNAGFHNCIFYWPDVDQNVAEEHKGWCWVQFTNQTTADKARNALSSTMFRGRKLKVGLPQGYTGSSHPSYTAATSSSHPPATAATSSSHPPATAATPSSHDPGASASFSSHPPAAAATSFSRAPGSSRSEYALPLGDGLPPEWIRDPENPQAYKREFFNGYKKLDGAYTGVLNRFLLAENEDGFPKFHSRQYPTPADGNKDNASIAHVFMTTSAGLEQEPDELKFKLIPVSRIPELEKDGWELWNPPETSIDPDMDNKDPRPVERIEDVIRTDQPYKDIASIFPKGMEMLQRQSQVAWRPGQLFGDNSEASESLSLAPDPKKPGDMTEMRTATSTGHLQKYKRPATIGVGWGDYDEFHQWQSYGRHINTDMVQQKQWEKDDDKPIILESDPQSGPANTMTITNKVGLITHNDAPQSLWDKLNTKRSQRGTHGNRGGRK